MKKEKRMTDTPGKGAPDMDKVNKTDENVETAAREERRGEKRRKEERRKEDRRNQKERRDKARIANLTEDVKEKGNEIENLATEVGVLKDTLLRRQADFENYKKRVTKQQSDNRKMTIKDIALEIIMINDDLHRAIEASSTIPDGCTSDDAHKSFVEGVTMISGRIEEMLGKFSVVEIDSINKEFDPNFNEAVEIEMSGDVKVDTVTKVHQKGFHIDDLVVRCAKVKVAKPGKPDDADGGSGSPDGNVTEEIA